MGSTQSYKLLFKDYIAKKLVSDKNLHIKCECVIPFDINGKIATNLDEYGADARKFLEEIYDDLYKTTNLLNPIREKYDYSKLPKEK